MTSVTFSGTYYYDGNYRFTEPGTYDVDEAKAEQLLRDFPDQFKAAGDAQKDTTAASGSLNLSKANRAQLEAVAADIGLKVTDEMDTNTKIKAAIEHHQKEDT